MKRQEEKFIIRATLFLIILISTLLAIGEIYTKTIYQNSELERKENAWQDFKEKLPNKTLDYAFFGDSHTSTGLNPQYIKNSYNFSSAGEDYIETYYRIVKLLDDENIKINNFIFEIDPHSFSDKLRTDEDLFSERDYYLKFVNLRDMASLKKESLLEILLWSKLKIIGEGTYIMTCLFYPPELVETAMGWLRKTEDFSTMNKTNIAARSIRKHFITNGGSQTLLNKRSLDYFIKILNLAKKENANILFISYPVSYDYDLALRRSKISRKEYYTKLGEEINNTISDYDVLDYYNLLFDRPEYFMDADHLNYKGAEILSKRVAGDLKDLVEKPVSEID